jgi:hypothetical protein
MKMMLAQAATMASLMMVERMEEFLQRHSSGVDEIECLTLIASLRLKEPHRCRAEFEQ